MSRRDKIKNRRLNQIILGEKRLINEVWRRNVPSRRISKNMGKKIHIKK